MPDFPSAPAPRPFGVVGSLDPASGVDAALISSTGSGTATWPVASKALYVPVVVERSVVAYQIAVTVAVQSGNLDVGIYTEDGSRLISSGSTAVGAAGVQAVNITDTTLPPGGYFLAMAVDNTTASFVRLSVPPALALRAAGMREQATAFALPSTATFANVAAAYLPNISIATAATI